MGRILSPMSSQVKSSMNDLLDDKRSNAILDVLFELTEKMPCAISLKEAQTGKYIYNNPRYIERLGLKNADEVIGLTADDLDMYKKWDFSSSFRSWKIDDLAYIKQADYQVKTTANLHSSSHIFFDCKGFIGFDNNTKLAILSRDNKKVVAILTYSYDLTAQYSLSKLLQLYRKYYPDNQAIAQLLKYLKINHYFYQLPTTRELEILFAMYQHTSRKRIGRYLDISQNTIASHIQHMKDKLLVPDFNEVLIQLRKVSANIDDKYT